MELKFNSDKFVIMQIADTQEGVNVSPDTVDLIDAAMNRVNPDLVVFSGDQIWGKNNFKGNREKIKNSLSKILEPVVSRKVPFSVCFGNHDRQVGLTNDEQLEIYKEFDGCVAESVEGIDGTANHVIEIKDGEKIAFLIYLIDSHTGLKVGYDCVHKNQIEWYKKTRDEYEKKTGSVVPSIVIQHIPLCEVFELLNEAKRTTKGSVQGFRNHAGKWYVLNKDRVNETAFMKESPAEPQENSGEFEAFKEKGDVLGVYFGHDHNNSFNGKVDGIDLGYTQGAGFNVYGPGLDRGVRVFEIPKDDVKNYKTYDLRFKELVGKKVKKPFKYAVLQMMPTNVFDAVSRLVTFFACVGLIALIVILITLFFG